MKIFHFLQGAKGPGPAIKNSSENLATVKQPAVKRRFNKHQICFSRLTPLQQQRREHISEIEYGLTQHPLALYPHLEESVNPEVDYHFFLFTLKSWINCEL